MTDPLRFRTYDAYDAFKQIERQKDLLAHLELELEAWLGKMTEAEHRAYARLKEGYLSED